MLFYPIEKILSATWVTYAAGAFKWNFLSALTPALSALYVGTSSLYMISVVIPASGFFDSSIIASIRGASLLLAAASFFSLDLDGF